MNFQEKSPKLVGILLFLALYVGLQFIDKEDKNTKSYEECKKRNKIIISSKKAMETYINERPLYAPPHVESIEYYSSLDTCDCDSIYNVNKHHIYFQYRK